MDKNLSLDFARVTEKAAIASALWVGKGDKHKADEAATEAMRSAFNNIDFKGTIVIGEGERDEAPMLFIGEEVGSGDGMEVDIAVDPLECTNSVAYGRPNAIAVLAAAPKGNLLHAPDTYMNKIAVGPAAKGKIDLDNSVEKNLNAVAKALDKPVEEVTVIILDRDRHKDLVEEIRSVGSRIIFIPDGDISAAIAPSSDNNDIDILLGVGAAPEGVIAAAALRCLGGEFQGRLSFRDDADKERAKKMGIQDLNKKYTAEELVKGDKYFFAATGVSTGPLLKGITFDSYGAKSHSLVMRGKTGTRRYITAHHKL